MPRKPKAPALPVPTETQEQAALVRWLQWHHVCFAAIPNGGKRAWSTGKRLKAEGLAKGLCDILIFDPAVDLGGRKYVGTALELKRRRGGRLQPEQAEWLEKLGARGWFAMIAKGAEEAIVFLRRAGYGPPICEKEEGEEIGNR